MDWLGRQVYSGRMTQSVKEMFSVLARRALHEFVNDRISETLQAAQNITRFQEDEIAPQQADIAEEESGEQEPKIITTAQELQSFDIVKDVVQDLIDNDRVFIRDSQTYCAILLDNNNRRPLCRLRLNSSRKFLGLFDGSRHSSGALVENQLQMESINDIYSYADQIRETVQRYLDS